MRRLGRRNYEAVSICNECVKRVVWFAIGQPKHTTLPLWRRMVCEVCVGAGINTLSPCVTIITDNSTRMETSSDGGHCKA